MQKRETSAAFGWVSLALGCGVASACAHAVEPNYQEGVAFMGAGGSGQPSFPIGTPSGTSTSPNLPASGGAPGVGGGGSVPASGGALGGILEGIGGVKNGPSGGVVGSGGVPAIGGGIANLGGAPGQSDAFECPPGVVPQKSFEVRSKSSTGLTPTNQINLALNLRHTGVAGPVPLNALSVRYWFNADGVTNLVAECDYAVVGCANVRTRFVSASVGGADTYLEVGFVSGAGNLAPNFETGEIQLRFHNANYQGSFLLGNDASAVGLTTDYVVRSTIPAYHACQLVWGTEPLAN